MNTAAPQPQSRVGLTIWMILSHLLTLGSLVIWLIVAGVPILFWDSPKGPDLSGWLFLLALWTYPVIPIGLSIAAWISYARRRNMRAAVLAGLSFAPLLLCLFWMSLSLVVPTSSWMPGR